MSTVTKSVIIGKISTLLENFIEVFPECPLLKEMKTKFDDDVVSMEPLQDMFISKWHDTMGNTSDGKTIYQQCAALNYISIFKAKIPFFEKIDLYGKWQDPEFDDDSREALFEHINGINAYIQIYFGVPDKVLSRIETTAYQLADQIQNGTLDMENFNLKEISQQVVSGMTQSEMKAVFKQVPTLLQSFRQISSSGR